MKKAVSLVFSSLVLATICSTVPFADTSTELKHKSRDLDKVQEELRSKRQEQEQLKREASQISKSLQAGETKLKGVQETLMHTKQKNTEVEMNLAESKNKRDRIDKEIRDTRSAVKEAFGVHYVVASLVGPTAPVPVYSQALYRSGLKRIDSMSDSKEEASRTYEDLTETYQVIQKQYQAQQDTLSELKSGLASKERLLQKKLTRRQILEEELKDLQKTAEELADMIDVLRTQAKKDKVEEKKSRQDKISRGQSPIARDSLSWPLQGKLTRRFGRQKHPELGTLYVSNGIVIQAPEPGPVRAVADGQVLYAGNFMSYGSMAVVEHPGDWYSVYGQLSRWRVEKGQLLKRGDVIGETGVSSTGQPETYFELRFYGKPVDPLPWLAGN